MGNLQKNNNICAFHNVGEFFESLIQKLSGFIVENDQARVKKIKSILYTNMVNNPVLHEELNLYKEVITNHFHDRFVAKAFLDEVLKCAKKHPLAKKLQEEMNKAYDIYSQVVPSTTPILNKIENANVYHALSEMFYYVRQNEHALVESRNHFKNIEVILEFLTKEQPIEEQESQLMTMPNLNLVIEHAVKRFNEKYGATLSPIKKEIIQDFLNYRSLDRFRSSLVNRLKKTSLVLEQLSSVNQEVPEIKDLSEKLNEYYVFVSQPNADVNINDMMLNVGDFLELSDELKNYVVATNKKAN